MEQWVLFLGRFHPLVVHLPIGILVAIVVVELFHLFRKTESDNTRDILLCVVLAAAVLSVATGLMLEQEGGYSGDRILAHKVLGIAMTFAIAITLFVRFRFRSSRGAYLAALGLSVILMVLGSHQGGILTHGRHFLTEHAFFLGDKPGDAAVPAESALPVEGVISYTHHIKPIMVAHCNECHNADKMKADLRLDSYEAIMKGSKFGAVVVPGDPEESTFYYLTTFPVDDPDRMPKDGDPLTTEQIQLIHDWIAQGAVSDE